MWIVAIASVALLTLGVGSWVVWQLTRPRCSRCRAWALARYTWPGKALAFVCVEHTGDLLGELAAKDLTPATVRLEWLDGRKPLPFAAGDEPEHEDRKDAIKRASRLVS